MNEQERQARRTLVTPELLAERAELVRVMMTIDEGGPEAAAIAQAHGWSDTDLLFSPIQHAGRAIAAFDRQYPAVKLVAQAAARQARQARREAR